MSLDKRPFRSPAHLLVPISVALAGVLLVGCSKSADEPISAASTRYQAADESVQPSIVREDPVPIAGDEKDSSSADAEVSGDSADNGSNAVPLNPYSLSQLEGDESQSVENTAEPDEVGDSPEQLLAEIYKIVNSPISGNSEQEQLANLRRLMDQRIELADRIIAQDPEPIYRVQAIYAKLDSLKVLIYYDQPGALQQMKQYADSLLDDSDEDVRIAAAEGKLEALVVLASGDNPDDAQQFEDDFRQLFASDTPQIKLAAVQAKLEHLSRIVRNDVPDAKNQFREFAQSLIEDGSAEIVQQGKIALISLKAGEISEGSQEDVESVLTDVQVLIGDGGPSRQILELAKVVVTELARAGHLQEAEQIGQFVSAAFGTSEDQELVAEANRMESQVKLIGAQVGYEDLVSGKTEDAGTFLGAVTGILAADNLGGNELNVLSSFTVNLEYSGKYEVAMQVYEKVEQAYANHSDSRIAEHAKRMNEDAKRRLGILGQQLELSGVTLEGAQFDWEEYRGKVVLVDFWASWCGPCRAEFPNVRRAYELYHDQGFEVVGINMDENPQALRSFMEEEALPWVNVVGEQPGPNPNAVRYDIQMIPFQLLVDHEGKVTDIHVRGQRLTDLLLAQFSSPDIDQEGGTTEPTTPSEVEEEQQEPADAPE